MTESRQKKPPIRYAAVGLGWFTQVAALPAFAHARETSRIAGLVSGDDEKLAELGERYGVAAERRAGYDGYDELLGSGEIDAVYIGLPNHLHREYAVRAAEAGVHVLCEKPMAVTEEECRAMIDAAKTNGVKLMIAYRLHFEAMNLRAVELVRSGRLGNPRLYEAVFANPVETEDDIRLNPIEKGGGTVYDIGIYCVNAARYLFRSMPDRVAAFSASSDDPRFRDCDETTSAILRFPGDRLATFVSTFGGSDRNAFRVVGTEGDLLAEPAFDFKEDLKLRWTIDGETSEEEYETRDQVAPELDYFSRCIQDRRDPEPGGLEGLADVRIIEAIHESARRGGEPQTIEPVEGLTYPDPQQEEHRPPPGEQDLVNVDSP